MLIQITNKCFMGCPHCLQNSTPEGEHMTFGTYLNALVFAKNGGASTLLLSGGEPTLHPQLEKFVLEAVQQGFNVCVCSNGTWDDDEKMNRIAAHATIQVYSNPMYYKDYDKVLNKFCMPRKNIVFTNEPIKSMQDLGRARDSAIAQLEVKNNRFHMSCLNGHLVARQSANIRDFFFLMESNGRFCSPMIDYKGNIHMSESHLCPSVGKVTDCVDNNWASMKASAPCGGCYLCKKFNASQDPKLVAARNILYGKSNT